MIKRDLDSVRNFIDSLVGKRVSLRYDKGRNRAINYKGRVEKAYSNVFVLTLSDADGGRLSCSYADMLCGEVSLKEI